MKYLSLLNEDEISYCCSIIPINTIANIFKSNPKKYQEFHRGYRAEDSSLSKMPGIKTLLYDRRGNKNIETIIEKYIGKLITWIDETTNKNANDSSFLEILATSDFASNVNIYFKLKDEKYTDEYVSIVQKAVNTINNMLEKLKEKDKEIESKDAELVSKDNCIKRQEKKINSNYEELESKKVTINEKVDLIKGKENQIKDINKKIEQLNQNIDKYKIEIKITNEELSKEKRKNKKFNKKIETLTIQLKEICQQIHQTKIDTQEQIELLKNMKFKPDTISYSLPKRPKNMNSFIDNLTDIFEAMDIDDYRDCMNLLIEHLTKILFRGIPIIINRCPGISLIKCISNSLMGKSDIDFLQFKDDITIHDIDEYLQSTERIACLDNFIGNFNETLFNGYFDRYKGKIIFLTYNYDRTLKYISEEFQRYVQYININRISVFNDVVEIFENNQPIEEEEYTYKATNNKKRIAKNLREILNDFEYPKTLIETICASVDSKEDFIEILTFNVLPYCVDVLQIKPFNKSDLLNKYVDKQINMITGNFVEGWFA
ncbi:MAG: hypothetical protein LBD41_06015 [Clostridiales Family XIII bacterium]|jgi:hypothetical protein|nr:hypothetical protein [Clostridiales Family XIII bacterium]